MTGDTAPFDAVAADYDASFSNRRIAQILRATVRRRARPHISSGCNVLEIGCGTGEDAIWFAEQGCKVLATDVSEKMLAVTRQKLSNTSESTGGKVELALLDASNPSLPKEYETSTFDLIFSNFGVLNCVAQLDVFARFAEEHLRDDGLLVANLMNRYCVWETVHGLLRGNIKRAFRRWSGHATWSGSGQQLDVYYPTVREVKRAFSPEFRLREVTGIGVFLPPSDQFDAVEPHTRLTRTMARFDKALAPWWPFNRLGDHVLLVLERQ